MVEGYIKVYRQLQDNPFWKEKPFSKGQAWVDLLFKANFIDRKVFVNGQLIEIKRGQLLRGIGNLAEEWGWSKSRVIRFLDKLENEGMIQKNGTPNGTLVTIEKYTFFQDKRNANESPDESSGESPDESSGESRDKNDKERKEGVRNRPPGQKGRLDWIDEL